MKSNARAVPLVDDRNESVFEAKVRSFAHEVSKRHRGRPSDHGALVLALRGYYRMWSLFERLPSLDERAVAVAIAEYEFVHAGRRTKAA